MDLMLPPGRLYHIAYVVPHLEMAQQELGAIFNCEWAPIAVRHHTVIAGADTQEVDFRLSYSITGPPHVELVEGAPGSIWDPEGQIRFHHVGLWSGDLAADAARFEAMGLPIVGHGVDEGGGMGRFTYHSNPYGPWIELVAPEVREPFAKWMEGEEFVT